jgi:hypothetical protein
MTANGMMIYSEISAAIAAGSAYPLVSGNNKNRANGDDQFQTCAASKNTQTSLDYGREKGGAIILSLRKVFWSFKAQQLDATMAD